MDAPRAAKVTGSAKWEWIGRVKEVTIPVIANGDIFLAAAVKCLEQTGADGSDVRGERWLSLLGELITLKTGHVCNPDAGGALRCAKSIPGAGGTDRGGTQARKHDLVCQGLCGAGELRGRCVEKRLSRLDD